MGCACAKEVVEIPPPSSHVPTPKQQQLQQQRLELNCTALILNHRSHILSEQIAGTDGAHPVATWVNQTKVDPRLDPAQFYLVSEPSSDKTPPRKQKGKSADAPTSNLLFDDEFDQLCSRSTNLTPVRPSSAHSDNFVAPREPESSDSRTPTVRVVCRIF